MNKEYRRLVESVQNRQNPENFLLEKSIKDELSAISYSDALTYVRLAMNAVDEKYTQRSKEAGERAKEHLKSSLEDVEYEYQGSVMTNTHIMGRSDIDLLVISSKFYSYARQRISEILESRTERDRFYPEQVEKLRSEYNGPTYRGDALEDLRNLRLDSEDILENTYDVCDTSGEKSIKITNKSLNRDVDIVISNWYDDVRTIIHGRDKNRGIQVYNKKKHEKGNPDYPFTSIDRINKRGSQTNGRLKKMIRFLKTVKADSEIDIDLSSFDFNAICYNIKVGDYTNLPYYGLVYILYEELRKICADTSYANDVVSVDGREYIFRYNMYKLENVRKMLSAVESIIEDLNGLSLAYG